MHALMKTALCASAVMIGMGAFALPAQAAPTLTFDRVIAKVVIVPEDRNTINAEVRNSGKGGLAKPTLTVQGQDLVISGGVDRDKLHNCHINSSHNKGVGLGLFRHIAEEDMPVITVRVPKDVKIIADGAIDAQVGNTQSIDVTQKHCGDWRLGDVSDRLQFSLEGVSNMHAGKVNSTIIELQGMGDVHIASTNSLEAGLQGMGDVVVDQVNGPVKVSLEGMGDLHIKGGHATSFTASLQGMGDIKFDGVADTVDASAEGMGDINVAKATGAVHKSNSGFSKVHVGQ